MIKVFKPLLVLLFLGVTQSTLATPTTPTSDFVDNGNGTVTHKKTGLIWQRCALGQTWTGTNCSGTASTYNYEQAKALTANFAGQSDWRLPNIAELETLVERDNYSPAINNTIFPNTIFDNYFWSSSLYASYDVMAWMMSFNYGKIYMGNKTISLPVRLVRAGQALNPANLFTPDTDFTDNGNGTVTHKRTGLTWMRCAIGQTWSSATTTCGGSYSTYSFDQAKALAVKFAGKSDWRLPNANELLSIAEYGAYPAINSAIFPNSPNVWFWSSSQDASFTSNAWTVYFSSGEITAYGKSNTHAVRLVSSTQTAPVQPTLYNLINASSISLNFATRYDAKNTKLVLLKNTSATAINVSNVIMSDSSSYWVNLFADSKAACRPANYLPGSKTFTIPANQFCTISIGFSPFDNLTANTQRNATLTIKASINGVASDKVINLTGLGRAQVANVFDNDSNLRGSAAWGVSELKGGNPPINTQLVGAVSAYDSAKYWYGGVLDKLTQKATASVGNLVVFASVGNEADSKNKFRNGHVGVVIQTTPVVTMLSMNDVDGVGKWSVKPINWYPSKLSGLIKNPLITGAGTTANQPYGFIDWNSSLY